MDKWNPDFPSNDDYWSKTKKFPGDLIRGNIQLINPDISSIELFLGKDISEWKQILYNKIHKIEIAYSCVHYYYGNGLSDNDDPFDMPDEDILRKPMFDFFIDTCFYHIYSAFDTIGQILNKRYQLGIDKKSIYFHTAISSKLKGKNEDLFMKFNSIKTGKKFKSAKLRNTFGHNIPPTEMLGFIIEFEGNHGSMKKLPYIPAKELIDMLDEALEALSESIEALKAI